MPRPPIGAAAMSAAEGQQRRRAKAKAARSAASPAVTTVPAPAVCASPQVACTPQAAALVFLVGDAEAIDLRILATVPPERAMLIAAALHRRLVIGGTWPRWGAPIIS
jgi:hypothetical protein